jgi:hypothetical protein
MFTKRNITSIIWPVVNIKVHFQLKFLFVSFVFIIYCIAFTSCKKNAGNDNPPTNPPTNNDPPNHFIISLGGISSDTATISWTPAIDPDNDSIKYKILLNDTILNANYNGLTYVLKNLKELMTYNVKIIAFDSKQNQTAETLTITTKKYWLEFFKQVEYGQISGYSSQKTGQMIKANDGDGYIIVGESELSQWPDGPFEMFTIKIDTLGNEIWQKFYNYSVGNTFEIKIVSNNSDGYIICGGDNIIKINNSGDLIWRQSSSYSQFLNAEINGIAVDEVGVIYAVGEFYGDSSINQFEAFLNKYDQNGNLVVSRKYSPQTDDYFFDIKITSNNELIVLGGSGVRTPNETRDFWVLNLTKDGDVIWSNTYPVDVGYAFPECIIQTKEGNYVFTGFTLGAYGIPYFHLQMIDANGNNMWSYYNNDNHTQAYSLSETNDNSLIVAGGYQLTYSMQSSLYKFDKSGNELWEKLYAEAFRSLSNKSVIPTNDGGYIMDCQESKSNTDLNETEKIYIFKTNNIAEFSN